MHPIPVEGPVELIDGKLILLIPFDVGGVASEAHKLGIGEVDGECLKVVVQPWLAEKLRIGPGSLVNVSVDTDQGNFSITRSAANDQPSGWRRSYWTLSLGRARSAKWLAIVNAVATAGAAAVLAITGLEHPGPTSDIDAQGYVFLAWLVCLPTAVLFALAAAAHWWRWPLRWLFQGLALGLPVVILLLSLT